MHYNNGREVKVGDPVIGLNNNTPTVGTVIHCQPGSETCNLIIHSTSRFDTKLLTDHMVGVVPWPFMERIIAALPDGTVFFSTTYTSYTASDFLHAEDALAACATEALPSVPAPQS